jgi:hypothetical protein
VHGAHALHGLPWVCLVKHTDLHLEQEEPRHIARLPGAVGLQGAIPTMGPAGLFVGHARDIAKGRDVWDCCRAQCVLPLSVMWARLTVAVWYFFNDVYPPLHNGHSPLDPPAWWIHLFDRRPAPVEETPETEEFVDPGLGRNAAPEVAAL